MKKLFLLTMVAAIGLVACSEDKPVHVTDVELSATTLTLTIGETSQLTATIVPEDAVETEVTWSTSDGSIATVAGGLVTAVAPGSATITATVGAVSSTCTVTVNPINVSAVTLDITETSLVIGGTVQLTATVDPANATNKTIVWNTTDEAVATVVDGLVTAVAVGEATITAEADGMFATCDVTVVAPAAVGDYYYSDGSYSTEFDSSKQVIGVVFWTGDPTATDPTLRKEKPNCNHGLVMALGEVRGQFFQRNYMAYNNTVSAWIEAKGLDYQPLTSGIESTDPIQEVNGYNNTKAIEAFNAAAENAEWPITAMDGINSYRTSVPAPESSSDWYLPSFKELILIAAGDSDELATDIYDYNKYTDYNDQLAALGGTEILEDYMSSTEVATDPQKVYDVFIDWWFWDRAGKTMQLTIRPVLAF